MAAYWHHQDMVIYGSPQDRSQVLEEWRAGEGKGGLGTTEQFMEHKLCITVSSARGRAQLGYRTGSRILLRIAQLGAELVISKVTDS